MGEHPALEYEAEGDQDLGIKTLPNIKFFICYNNLKHTNQYIEHYSLKMI